jgi:hypothetical protein
MVFLVALAVVAFFWLAAVYGVDSRPYDSRSRRWV